ncbi:MAG: TrkA family potassium uptake protein, partial [Muribaculaceae bacterium]|nr:TrkA family potassium uptake protein [Muribaculaceae bacterium]
VPFGWIGKSIIELQVRQKHQVNILAVKKNGILDPLPGPDHVFSSNEMIYVMN